MRGIVIAIGMIYSLVAGAGSAAPLRTTVIDSGRIEGVAGRSTAIAVFKSIPYAAPPVGPLRFRAPQTATRWAGTRKADRFGDICPQLGSPPPGLAMSEDCLTANVWTGATSAKQRRPVFVWIYGGGFSQGTAANPQFDGEGLAKKGVVVVTFNYRLGALGFLATPGLSAESGQRASGNYGLLDDIALLHWVRRNIAAFGGDPARVTIGGQSAGAGSCGFLAMSPLAKGLFRAAILQSHARHPGDPELRYLSTSWRSLKDAETAGTAYASARKAATPADLRALPWQKLVEGSDVSDEATDTLTSAKPPLFRPVIDGWVLPASYAATYAAGRQNPVAILAGSNRDETGAVPEAAFAMLRARSEPPRGGMPPVNVTLAAYTAWAQRKYGAMADEFLRLYPAATDDDAARMGALAARDNSRTSTFLWGQLWTRSVGLPVYTYFWGHARPGPDAATRGAFHGSEIGYVFDSLDATPQVPWTGEDRRIADAMSSYWANFIKTGNPNGAGMARWPRYDRTAPRVMGLGDSFAVTPVATPDRLDFWNRFFASQTQW